MTASLCPRCAIEHKSPSCPTCGRADAAIWANHIAGNYLCCLCSTLFDGTEPEWERHRERRVDYRARWDALESAMIESTPKTSNLDWTHPVP